MELLIDLESQKTNKRKELIYFLKEGKLSSTIIKSKFTNGDKSDMGLDFEFIIQVIIATTPITAAVVGVLNCIKAYIEVNPKDKVKIKIRGVELEFTKRNYNKIETTLKKILEIEEKYSNN
jgi:hypothetical protein